MRSWPPAGDASEPATVSLRPSHHLGFGERSNKYFGYAVFATVCVAAPLRASALDQNAGGNALTPVTAQIQCADAARNFYLHIYKGESNVGAEWNYWYESHFNNRLNRCFIAIYANHLPDDFFTMDLFDAIEKKHFAEYIGHGYCNAAFLAEIKHPKRCALDSGVVWLHGDDQENPDMHFGYEGTLNGPGLGGPDTKQEFLRAVQPFLTQ